MSRTEGFYGTDHLLDLDSLKSEALKEIKLPFDVQECLHFHSIIDDFFAKRFKARHQNYLTEEILKGLHRSLDYFCETDDLQKLALKCLLSVSISVRKGDCLPFMLRLFIFVGFFGSMKLFNEKVKRSYGSERNLPPYYFQSFPLVHACAASSWFNSLFIPLSTTCLAYDCKSDASAKFLEQNIEFKGMDENEKLKCVLREWIGYSRKNGPILELEDEEEEDLMNYAWFSKNWWNAWMGVWQDSFDAQSDHFKQRKIQMVKAYDDASCRLGLQ